MFTDEAARIGSHTSGNGRQVIEGAHLQGFHHEYGSAHF